jgi:hypothetical protein
MDPLGRARRLAGDSFARSIVISIALIAAGFVAIGLAWRGVARSVLVPEQLSFLVSGGIGGLALILAGAGTLAVQSSRYWNARERRQLDRLIARASALGPQDSERGSISRVSAPPK